MAGKQLNYIPKPRPTVKSVGVGPKTATFHPRVKTPAKVERYAKPTPAKGLPKWFLDIRAGSEFMPAKIKPYSYNYMSLVESPNRQGLYAPGGWAQPNNDAVMNLNMQFNVPTEDVAKGIGTSYNLQRDEINLGLEPTERKTGFLWRAMDIISRPLYTIANQHKQNVDLNYRQPGSAGGEQVTFGEHIQGWIHDFTPVGVFNDVRKGQFDDRVAAAWRGFSGKDKTTTATILEEEYPGFVEKHPKGAIAASIVGDFALDPINWVSFGAAGPGTVTKSVASNVLRSVGRKELAKKLLDETLFTSVGRNAAKETLRLDAFNAELRRLGRVKEGYWGLIGGLDRKAAKAAAGKKTKLTAMEYNIQSALVAKAIEDAVVTDLKGADLAWRTIKRGLPTAGIGTLSRANLGASHWRKVEKGNALVNAARTAFIGDLVKDAQDEEHWKSIVAAFTDPETGKIEDFTYTSSGRTYTVKFSDAKDSNDFLTMVFTEGAPLAKLQEGNIKAGRARNMRIGATEARGRDFMAALTKKIQSDVGNSLASDAAKDFDKLRTRAHTVASHRNALDTEINDPQLLHLTEDTLDNLSFDSLMSAARKKWESNVPDGQKTKFGNSDPVVMVHREDGVVKKVSIRNLKAQADSAGRARVADMKARAATDLRTATQRAEDASKGITDPVARARARMIEAHKQHSLARANKAAEAIERLGQNYVGAVGKTQSARAVLQDLQNLAPQEVKEIFNKVVDALNSDRYTEAEKKAFNTILNDFSIPMDERVAKVLSHMDISDEEVGNIVRDIAQFEMRNGEVFASIAGEGSGPEMLNKIINAVLKHRVTSRIGKIDANNIDEMSPILKASGVKAVTDESGNVTIVKLDKADGLFDVNYQRDLVGELGMAVLDAYRYAIDYAVKRKMLDDPELLFTTIRESVDGFINKELAGIKRDVFQLIHNITGVRFPEEFVPKLSEIDTIFPKDGSPSSFKWKNADGKEGDQIIPWDHLSNDMQRWTYEVFKKDMKLQFNSYEEFAAHINDAKGKPVSTNAHTLARMEHWRSKVQKLVESATASPRALNDTTPVVNRYSFLDYLIHGDSILKSQDMTISVTSQGTKEVSRLTSGRLSALDSFAYVDEEVRQGIEALSELKKLMKNKDEDIAQAAQAVWMQMFEEAGGLKYLEDVQSQKFNDAFSTLGIHARLKEDVVGTGSKTLGTKQRADLMEALWGTKSLHHEWQKAMQQRILHDTMVDGYTRATAAHRIAYNIEEFFKDYENIKRIIHPVRVNDDGTKEARNIYNLRRLEKEIQANRVNKFSGSPQQPNVMKSEVTYPYDLDVDNLVVSSKPKTDFTFEGSKLSPREWLELHMPKDPGIRATARIQGDVGHMRDSIMKHAGELTIHEIKEGDTLHGLIIERPVKGSQAKKIRYLVTPEEAGGPLIHYRTMSTTGTPTNVFNDLIQPSKRQYRGSTIEHGKNIQGASVSGKVNVVEPKTEFVNPGAPNRITSAWTGTTADQRSRVADLLSELGNVNRARQAEEDALTKLQTAQRNPDTIGVKAAAEEKAFKDARRIYVRQMQNPDSPVEAADFVNASDEVINYSTKEVDRIRDWIAQTYAGAPPHVLAREMHAFSNAISQDIMVAQGQMISYMRDYGIKHKFNFKVFGIPLMNTPHAMNMTHTEAGVTALAQSQSRARRALTSHMDPSLTTGQQKELAINYRRRSHVLNQELDRIAAMYANPASIMRQQIIPALNRLYGSLNKGTYLDPAVGALSRKARFKRINNQLFNPAANKTGDPLKMFDQAETYKDGTPVNPVKEIQTYLHEISVRMFVPERLKDPKDGLVYKRERLNAYNKFMIEKYRLNEAEIDYILTAEREQGHVIKTMQPYTVEWLREVGDLLPSSKLSREKLLNINLGEFHYALHDAKLKIEAGDALHVGVWDEFSSIMKYDQVKFINDKVNPQTLDSKGEQMRGKLISIKEISDNLTYGIKKEYIPKKFRTGEYYISEDLLPEIKVLFDYMDKSHQLNDIINTRFFEKVFNYFKQSVTIYNIPAYPIRNLMSDVFLSAMDGLVNPRYYGDAAKIVWSQRQDMKNMNPQEYTELLDQNFMAREASAAQHDPDSVMDPMRNPNKPVVLRLQTATSRIELNEDQVMHLYDQLGLGQNRVSGDIPEATDAARLSTAHSKVGKVTDQVRKLNDIREDWGRMAHFLYALEREAPLGGGLDQIARRAGDRVIKYHFDYSDVSLWERKKVAPYIPFYKWTKNIIPFTLANMVLNPKFLNIERAINAGVGNIINDDPNDDKEDFIIADWIKDDLPVPIGSWTDPEGNKFQQFASMYLPLSGTITGTLAPTLDPLTQFAAGKTSAYEALKQTGSGAATTGLAMMNPGIKSGYQAVSGEVPWASGSMPEGESDWIKSLKTIIPGVPILENLARTGESYTKEGTEGKNEIAALLQLLGIERVYNNTESAQKGQLKQMEDAQRGNINKGKADLVKKLKEKYPDASDEDLKTLIDDYLMPALRENDAARL